MRNLLRISRVERFICGLTLSLILLDGFFSAAAVTAGPCLTADLRCEAHLRLNLVKPSGPSGSLRYFSSFRLDRNQRSVTRAVIVVHGMNRNADVYFRSMTAAATDALATKNTVIIAPQFLNETDGPVRAKNELYWNDLAWKQGDDSISPNLDSVSSFEVIKQLIFKISNRHIFPNLREIVLVGHSAGAQFVQRFAGTYASLGNAGSPNIRMVVVNPSSYMYLNNLRPTLNRMAEFDIPFLSECFATYNDYRFGLENPNNYLSKVAPDEIRTHYISNHVIYLLGENDNDPKANDLDQSCPAALEGSNRLERGLFFFSFLKTFYPKNKHGLVLVPGVDHNGTAMFRSPEGLRLIFEPK